MPPDFRVPSPFPSPSGEPAWTSSGADCDAHDSSSSDSPAPMLPTWASEDPRHELLRCLMRGLAEPDQRFVVERIQRAREEQMDRKVHPPRRRCRDAAGELVPRSAIVD